MGQHHAVLVPAHHPAGTGVRVDRRDSISCTQQCSPPPPPRLPCPTHALSSKHLDCIFGYRNLLNTKFQGTGFGLEDGAYAKSAAKPGKHVQLFRMTRDQEGLLL